MEHAHYEGIDAGEKVAVITQQHQRTAMSANLTTFCEGKAVEMVHYPGPKDALAAAGVWTCPARIRRGQRYTFRTAATRRERLDG